MTIRRRQLIHEGPGGPFEGVFAWDDSARGGDDAAGDARPGVLVIPNVLGQKAADDDTAAALAQLGYAAFACDVYGQGRRTRRGPDQARYMDELNADRALLRDRMAAALAALKAQDEVDEARTAAIGFCFGGKCVLDMARAGLPFLGGVSFHGVYDRPDLPGVAPIAARLLLCHGWDDPLAPPDALVALGQELTVADADWQVQIHGGAGHAFTDRSAVATGTPGFGFDARADRRSWTAMRGFLQELLAHS